jgi:predicted small metal-binding protein
MAKVINCDRRVTVRGETDDELVENAQQHAKEAHDMEITREQALAIAVPA